MSVCSLYASPAWASRSPCTVAMGLYFRCIDMALSTWRCVCGCVYVVFMVELLSFIIWLKLILVAITYVVARSSVQVCVLDPSADSVASM